MPRREQHLAEVTSRRVLACLELRLLYSLALSIVLLSVLLRRSLLRPLPAFGLFGLLGTGVTALAVCVVGGSSISALLSAIERASHLLELGEAVRDGLGSAVCDS